MTVTTTKQNYGVNVIAHSVDIANAGTTSDTIQMDDASLVGVILPVAHTNATLELHGSFDNINFFAVKEKDGTAMAITTANVTGFYKFLPSLTDGIPFLRFVSSGAEGAARNFQAVLAHYK